LDEPFVSPPEVIDVHFHVFASIASVAGRKGGFAENILRNAFILLWALSCFRHPQKQLGKKTNRKFPSRKNTGTTEKDLKQFLWKQGPSLLSDPDDPEQPPVVLGPSTPGSLPTNFPQPTKTPQHFIRGYQRKLASFPEIPQILPPITFQRATRDNRARTDPYRNKVYHPNNKSNATFGLIKFLPDQIGGGAGP